MQLETNESKIHRQTEQVGIVFDMDGVIIDTCLLHEESWFYISKQYGFPWKDNINFRRDIFGTSSVDSAKLLFGNMLAGHDLSVLIKEKDNIYSRLLKKNANRIAIPGFLYFFKTILDAKIPVALATSAEPSDADYVLKNLGIYKKFNAILDISMVKKAKPAPEIYLKACDALGLQVAQCIGFEDSLTGIKALQNAGLRCVVVGSSITEGALAFHGLKYEHYIKDFNELTLDKVINY